MDRDVEAGMMLEGDSLFGGPARAMHGPRSLSFYVASSRDGLEDARMLMAVVRRHGCKVAFDWTEHLGHRCSTELCGIADRQVLAHREVDAASRADWLIGCARLGKGSHVELGIVFGAAYMCGHSPRILLVGVWDGVGTSDSVFYEHADVRHVADVEAAVKFIEAL